MTVVGRKLHPTSAAFTASRVFDQIVIAIAQGNVAADDRCSISTISERFGVSRTIARDALARLRRCRLVAGPSPNGAIAPPSPDRLREIAAIHNVLIGLAARLAAMRITNAEMTELADSLARQKALIERTDAVPALIVSENDRFHDILARASGNVALVDSLQSDLHRAFIIFVRQDVAGRPAGLRRTYVEHCRIVDAIDDRDPDLAEFMARRLDAAARRSPGKAAPQAMPRRAREAN